MAATLSTRRLALLEDRLHTTFPDLTLRYNIAPSEAVPVIRKAEDGYELVMARWGLVPSWAKDPKTGYRMINARAETVAEKPAFRSTFRHRRCLIPADGFYEWRQMNGRKIPFTRWPSGTLSRAPAAPPSAKPRKVSRSASRHVRRAQRVAIPGSRSVKMCRSHCVLMQKNLRASSRNLTL